MILSELSEVVWRFYQNGRPDTTKETFVNDDIKEMVMLAAGLAFREQFYQSKRLNEFNQPDYSFVNPLLSVKRFELPESDIKGLRRADMGDFDLFRLPKNAHFTNVYAITGDEGCGNEEVGELTQVNPGEENFYIGNPDFSTFKFYVPKGRGLNTYNIPLCIKFLDVETTYDMDDADISLDIGFQVASQVLARVLQTNDATGQTQKQLKRDFEKMEGAK